MLIPSPARSFSRLELNGVTQCRGPLSLPPTFLAWLGTLLLAPLDFLRLERRRSCFPHSLLEGLHGKKVRSRDREKTSRFVYQPPEIHPFNVNFTSVLLHYFCELHVFPFTIMSPMHLHGDIQGQLPCLPTQDTTVLLLAICGRDYRES